MSKRFSNLTDKISFPEEEEKTIEYWNSINAFETSIKLSEGRPEYSFYDGPPFATGLPHYGHLLAGTIKDTVTRYAHQTGHYVSRRFGWDCHGLPVEYEIDKKLNITGRDMVLEMGIDKYNNECRSIVQRYTKEWEKTVNRLGRWIDFKNDYKTMDPEFMESVWWVFKTLFEKGLVYRGYKVMPYSTACGTPLSNFEAGLNYKDVKDPAAVVSFPLINESNVSLIAWTTTPWTLPSNLALCVNPSFTYIKIIDKTRNNKIFILLEKRLSQLFPEVSKADCTEEKKNELYTVLERMVGSSLVGLKYTPLFSYYSDLTNAFRVVSDNYVTEEGGTGIVHQAPAFGEDDYRVCLTNNIISKGEDLPCPVDANGRFTSNIKEFAGKYVKEADNEICTHLKGSGRLVMKETYAHSYPFCWRSETPLIYKAVPSWFVAVEKVKDKLLHNNTLTYWVPSFVQEKRFHNWLADAKDWAISRNRFWGTPIPLWISDDLEEMVSIGSVDELEKLSGVRVTDLHKEFVDKITIPSQKGKGILKRIDEVFDCWFESGSMPYAQLHYPFENKERFEQTFPADFIAEGLDQTRGWFYTLSVIATCLFDQPAFKNLIVNGLVLAADGKKMSKRLKNYPDPIHVLNSYGADALRLYLINSPVVRADVLKFTEDGVNDIVRGVLLPWFNAFRFFIQCIERMELSSNKSFIPDSNLAKESKDDIDVWILASTYGLVKFVHQEMKAYRLYTVVPRLLNFIEQLTNWYVRLNRDRLKGSFGDVESVIGLNVLYEVLLTMTSIMSPFTPFFAEYLYQSLRKLHINYNNNTSPIDSVGRADSIHYVLLPQIDDSRINILAENRFKTLQTAVQLARLVREKKHIRSNLPLKNVIVVCSNEEDIEALNYLKSYFMSEINAWNIELSLEWQKLCTVKVIPNFKEIGTKVGKNMKEITSKITNLSMNEILDFMSKGSIIISEYEFTKSDIIVKREFNGDNKIYQAEVSDDGSIVVAVDYTLDDNILQELRARQFGAIVQKVRKTKGLQVSDIVEIFYEDEKDPNSAIIADSLLKHSIITLKRIKTIPLPLKLKPKYCQIIANEVIKDQDISKNNVTLQFTSQVVSIDKEEIRNLLLQFSNDEKILDSQIDMIEMNLQTIEYSKLISSDSTTIILDTLPKLVLSRNKHYYNNVLDLVTNSNSKYIKEFKSLPTLDTLKF